MSGSTRILSWQQLVLEADPNWARGKTQPWIYQFSNGRLFYSPVDPYAPYPDDGLYLNGGFLMLDELAGYPDSDAGLMPGAIWSNNLWVMGIPGGTPYPGAPPLFFPGVTASQLLLAGAANLPLESGAPGLIYINGGFICVSL